MIEVSDACIHPPTHPFTRAAAAHSNRLRLLYPTHPPTHPPTFNPDITDSCPSLFEAPKSASFRRPSEPTKTLAPLTSLFVLGGWVGGWVSYV